MIYFLSLNAILASALTQNDFWSWLSFVGYSLTAFGLLSAEYEYGTEAIRYLNNDYYKDPRLIPSFFYLIGWAKHQETDSFTFDQDPSIIDDMPIDQFNSTIAF